MLRFDYAVPSSADRNRTRRAEPHHVVVSRGSWYLVAWDLDADDWRTSRLDRRTPRIPTGPRFVPREVPGRDVAAYVAARFKGSAQDDAWPCRGQAVIALPSHDVTPFAGDGIVEGIDAQHCRLTVGSWSWTALTASFGRFDAQLTEVSPSELRGASADLAARVRRAAPLGAEGSPAS